MTEAEAKTKWCPMVRGDIGRDIGVKIANRGGYGNDPDQENSQETTNCIASACMMWRAHLGGGSCGLAGKP
jgi:hypothetical protein